MNSSIADSWDHSDVIIEQNAIKVRVAFITVSAPNVPDDLSLLASGVPPAREAKAGGMTEVPKA